MSIKDNYREENDLNEILSELGIGKFQVINFVVLCMCVLLDTLREDTYLFTASNSSYRCLIPECENSLSEFNKTWLTKAIPFENNQLDKCLRYSVKDSDNRHDLNASCNVLFDNTTVACESWIYDKGLSIVEELEIPCEEWKRRLVASLNSGGQLVSYIFSGFIADKYGRRNVLIIMILLGGCIGILQSFSQHYLMFAILEFFNMSFGSGAYGVAYVMAVESLSQEKRIYGGTILEITCCLSKAILGVFGWLSKSWRWLIRICDIPCLFAIVFFFILPESIRWLRAKGKGDKCKSILMNAAKLNGITYSQDSLLILNQMSTETNMSSSEHSLGVPTISPISFISIIKSPCLLQRLVLCAFCRFACVLIFTGIDINSVNISTGKNAYVDFILVTLTELPSILVYYILLKYVSRRTGLQMSFFGTGIFCIIYGSVSFTNETYELVIFIAVKFFLTITSTLSYMYISECFPTTLRSSSVNFCAIVGRIGGIVAPQLLLLLNKSLQMIVFGVVAFINIILVFKLPDTRNKKLPDTITEAEQL